MDMSIIKKVTGRMKLNDGTGMPVNMERRSFSGSAARLEADSYWTSQSVLKLVDIVGYHPYPLSELMLMSAAFQYHEPDLVIDIGTHFGKSARIWHEMGQQIGKYPAIHTIDICDRSHPEFPGDDLGKFIRGTPVKQHIGDGFAVAGQLLKENAGSKVLLFLDGDHSFETVRRELELTGSIANGCVLLHDTFYQPGSSYNHGPYLAIEDFLKGFQAKQVLHLQTGLPGMSYIGL